MRLLRTHTLTFTTPSQGYYDALGEWNDGASTPVIARGSLQAFRRGVKRLNLPDGVLTTDARLFYSKTLLQAPNENQGLSGAYTTIGTEKFVVVDVEPNSDFGLKADHNVHLLVKEARASAFRQ